MDKTAQVGKDKIHILYALCRIDLIDSEKIISKNSAK